MLHIITKHIVKTSNNLVNKIILIPRGGCNFVTKATNAQKLGAMMVIIMDN